MPRPQCTALTMVAKESSSITISLASLDTSVPAMPMAMPTSDGGRVVDAVAGHRHHIALGFQSVHHAHLDNRRAAGDHADAADFAGQFLVAHFLDLARLDGDMPLVQNAEFVGDGRGGHDGGQ